MKKLDKPEVRALSPEEKMKILQAEMATINKKFGKPVVTIGKYKVQQRIPFKSEKMNATTGGGAPCGKFTVIWGSKGSAKTTSCYELVANAQEMGKTCMWIDFERSFDPIWAAAQGVNVDTLLFAPAFENAESAMDTAITMLKTKALDLIVIDSIQGMSPLGEQETKKGVEKSMVDDTMALLAKKLSQFFRMSAGKVYESDCTFILIGQTRTELGGFVTLDKLSGGNALEHWSSLTIHVRRGKQSDAPFEMVEPGAEDKPEELEDVEEASEDGKKKKSKKKKHYLGFSMVAKVDKSKVGADEGKECKVTFRFGKGLQNE